ncbi:hypothetical protein THAOC_30118 [Thalassiosira oceanica]|uniref:Uncharacterized protein n=1 Tax=Thalassiosira oceanica TaxID=159749 RepID=K0RVS7_THAOC|nr:hypothetical protein THAOC_30118 [Thalassiosira oceanica]|eukprot:EJK50782.1 hypothetical protein THAOC_30118 [Thalassiosira oceanica]
MARFAAAAAFAFYHLTSFRCFGFSSGYDGSTPHRSGRVIQYQNRLLRKSQGKFSAIRSSEKDQLGLTLRRRDQSIVLFSSGDDGRGDDEDDCNEEQQGQGMSTDSIGQEKGPSAMSKLSSAIFIFASYCFQFIGAFFGFGLLLNILGYGYTIDLRREQPLVVEKISDLRNELQFEREIEREMRQDSGEQSTGPRYLLAPTVSEVRSTNRGGGSN